MEDGGQDTAVPDQGTRAAHEGQSLQGRGDRPHSCDLEPTDAEQIDSGRVQDAAVLRTALCHNKTTVILRFQIQRCPIPGSVPGYVGWEPEQPNPVNDILPMAEGLEVDGL